MLPALLSSTDTRRPTRGKGALQVAGTIMEVSKIEGPARDIDLKMFGSRKQDLRFARTTLMWHLLQQFHQATTRRTVFQNTLCPKQCRQNFSAQWSVPRETERYMLP